MKNYLLILLVLFTCCSKRPKADKDYDPPVIILTTPTNNQVFTAGQDMMISGLVTDNKYILQLHIEITNLITAEAYLHVHIHPASNVFNFNQSFTVQAGISYKIRVIADDPSANSSAKVIEVFCN